MKCTRIDWIGLTITYAILFFQVKDRHMLYQELKIWFFIYIFYSKIWFIFKDMSNNEYGWKG